mgnify:CR=1 FL=1
MSSVIDATLVMMAAGNLQDRWFGLCIRQLVVRPRRGALPGIDSVESKACPWGWGEGGL